MIVRVGVAEADSYTEVGAPGRRSYRLHAEVVGEELVGEDTAWMYVANET